MPLCEKEYARVSFTDGGRANRFIYFLKCGSVRGILDWIEGVSGASFKNKGET